MAGLYYWNISISTYVVQTERSKSSNTIPNNSSLLCFVLYTVRVDTVQSVGASSHCSFGSLTPKTTLCLNLYGKSPEGGNANQWKYHASCEFDLERSSVVKGSINQIICVIEKATTILLETCAYCAS